MSESRKIQWSMDLKFSLFSTIQIFNWLEMIGIKIYLLIYFRFISIIIYSFIKGLLGSNESKIIKFNNNNDNLFENMFSSFYYFDMSGNNTSTKNDKELNKFTIILQDIEDNREEKKIYIEENDKLCIEIIVSNSIDIKLGNNNRSSESLLDIEINELLAIIFEIILMINISNDIDLLLLLKDNLNPTDIEFISSYNITNDSNFNYNTTIKEEKNYFSFNQLKNIITNTDIKNSIIDNNLDILSQKSIIEILNKMEINCEYISFLVINNPLLFSSIYLR